MTDPLVPEPAAAPARPVVARLRHAMAWLLAVFLLLLPLGEAPKNIVVVLFVLAWIAHAVLTRDVGGRWDRLDTAFAVLFGSILLSSVFGDPRTLVGTTRLMVMSWMITRTPLTEREDRRVIAAGCIGLLLSLVAGAIPYLRGTKAFLELPSVGHVNQSALYIAVFAAAALGWWLQAAIAHRPGHGARDRAALGACAALFAIGLVVTGSRAAMLAAIAAAAVILATVVLEQPGARSRRLLVRTAAGLALAVAVAWGVGALSGRVENKLTVHEMMRWDTMQDRMRHWRIAYEAWRQRPWVGWGPDSFQKVPIVEVCRWRAARGEDCDWSLYRTTAHAHSLYVGTLMERGLTGIAALAVFLGIWAGSLLRLRRSAADSPWWLASAAGFLVVVLGGLFQTTLRVEHGALALVFLGLWWARERAARRGGGRVASPGS